jgi:hypothetical protein
MNNVQILTDCMQVVQSIRNKLQKTTEIGIVIEPCSSLLII